MPPYHLARDPKISSYSGDDKAILDIKDSENYLLILGPDIARSINQTSFSLFHLLEGMVSWCIQEGIIKGCNTIEDFQEQYGKKVPFNEKLVKIGYILEENLSEKHQQRTCLKAVLDKCILLEEISQLLKNKSFRGYISTTYDTFIETAYAKKTNRSLSKFYAPSIDGAIKACRNGQPFMLKLYGDIDEPASIVLGSRFSKGLFGICAQEALCTLLTIAPTLFVGFEEKDPDLALLSRLAIPSIGPPRTVINRPLPPLKRTYEAQFQGMQEHSEHSIIHEPPQNYLTSAPFFPTPPLLSTIKGGHSHSSAAQEMTEPSSAPVRYRNNSAVEVFTAYVPADNDVKEEVIKKVLNALKRQGWHLIDNWGNALVPQECESNNYLETAHLVLLLISYDFLDTPFSISNQLKKMVEPSTQGKRRQIVPIIASAVGPGMLRDTAFGHLPHLPKDGKPADKKKKSAIAEIGDYIRNLLDGWKYY